MVRLSGKEGKEVAKRLGIELPDDDTPRESKYHNRRTEVGGVVFDSQREANRYAELLLLERAGEITDLQLQVPYDLVVNGESVGKYLADFQYRVVATGAIITEDSKGLRLPVYALKKRLMKAIYDIDVKEV